MSTSAITNITYSGLGDLLTDCSIDRVMAINNEWKIIAWNSTCEFITGLDRQSVLGKKLTAVFPAIADDPEIMLAIERAFAGFKSFLPSVAGRFNRHHIENHYIPLRDADNQPIGVMNIMHDVSHRLKAEMQLARLNEELEKKYQQLQEANQSLLAFTNLASREIQEPVRNIYTSLEMLAQKEGNSLTPWSRGNLRKMQASLNRINLLLADLLSISHVTEQTQKSAAVDLNEIVAKVIKEMNPRLEAKDAWVKIGKLPTINGYPEMLKYLLHHLIENALKFQQQDQQPQIAISSEHAEATDHSYHKLCVSDNGIGLDTSESAVIFEMFRRLHPEKFKGSGIGLALCKKIMELHGGSIYAEGVPGKGATICCLFPATESKNMS